MSDIGGTHPTASRDHFLKVLDSPWYRTLVDIQDALSRSTRFFQDRGLRAVHLPITTHSISSPMGLGSDSHPVEVELFGIKTYLADSMQFMLEYGCRLSPQGCYYMMPSFRGEQADETHLCQFYHIEAEIPGTLDTVIRLVEEFLRHAIAEVLASCRVGIERVAGGTEHLEQFLAKGPLSRLTLEEATTLLGNDPAFVRWHEKPSFPALTRRGERELMRLTDGFVWVTDFDHLAVPFYQAFTDGHRRRAKAADLLFGLGEVVGSGERHTTPADVLAALQMHDVDPAPYQWYMEMRRHTELQTSGFGLGTERFICWVLKHDDVRNCQVLPRYNGHVTIP